MSGPLDLADLTALPATVDALGVERLDAVVLNAGILLSGPRRRVNSRGHESMFATNHLGHFALVAHLMPRLTAASRSRVVTVGSFAARSERLDLTDLQSERDYRPKRTYGRSKLAQMMIGFELDRRLRACGAGTASIVRATLDPEITGGELWGPRVFGLRGRPHRETPHAHMPDVDTAAELWDACADLTGVCPLRCPALPR